MTKKEIIWRQVLHESLHKQATRFTQKELAARFRFSLSTIHHALSIPRKIGAVEVTGRFFRVRDPEKLLYLWATQRHLKRDTVYATHVDMPVQKIEAAMPPDVVFGAFSAYRFAHKDVPADYDAVYVYAADLDTLKRRFPPQKGYENFMVLKSDPPLMLFGHTTPDIQTFVDIWNTSPWYAKDFLNALKEKMKL